MSRKTLVLPALALCALACPSSGVATSGEIIPAHPSALDCPSTLPEQNNFQLGPSAPAPACDEFATTRHDDALFQQLTAAKWQESCQSAPGGRQRMSCSSLSLRKNGIYNWNTFSDVSERSDTGGWNFVAHDRDSGVLFLGEDTVLPFEFVDGQLVIPIFRGPLSKNSTPFTETGERGALPKATPPELYCEVINGSWERKTASSSYLPKRVTFTPGKAKQVFDTCERSATWGIVPKSSPELFIAVNTCDGKETRYGFLAQVEHNTLTLDEPFQRRR
jgi:hypothetical protein